MIAATTTRVMSPSAADKARQKARIDWSLATRGYRVRRTPNGCYIEPNWRRAREVTSGQQA